MKRTITIALVLACLVSMAFAAVDSEPVTVTASDAAENVVPAEESSTVDNITEADDATVILPPIDASQELPVTDNMLSTPVVTE